MIGTTSTALGMDGAHPGSDWYEWEQSGRAPLSGGGAGGTTRFVDDAALLAEHGIGHHRVVIDWSRVAPRPGGVDPAAIERERERLQALVAAGVRPWVALHHIALPGWFVDDGGFADDRARGRHWPRFVDEVAEAVGDLVEGWFPVIDPAGWARAGHLAGTRPPGRRDPEAFAKALRGIWLAWRDAWRQLHGGAPPVATALDLSIVRAGDDTVTARSRARERERIDWGVAVTALRDGVIDIPGLAAVEVDGLRESTDLVGFSYAGAVALDGEGTATPYPAGARQPWVEGFATTLHRLAELFPSRPIVIAGHGAGTADDEWRCDLLRETFAAIDEARRDGIDVRGYFHRSAIDSYEPDTGCTVPWGVFDRDRNARPSAAILAAGLRR